MGFRFFAAEVARTEPVGASALRVTVRGTELAGLRSGGRDQRIKLLLPHPHQPAPLLPARGEDWFSAWRAMDPAERAVLRTYTVAAYRHRRGFLPELDVDFVLHGGGLAAGWAARALPGDPLVLLGPDEPDNPGVDFRPPAGTDWVLLAADATALPAAAGILESLPAGQPARVWITVPDPRDIRELRTAADASVTWLTGDADLVRAITATELPPAASGYAWLAGEAATVRGLRRELLAQGFPRSAVTFTGYWRRGATEETRLAAALAGASEW
ncbi:siderophore-interacting protein [Phaeacidiphilus oryzae]|uniref:siderophore-interacting protein n=1 Tax=Phaeacidiphilus oryzae TaxID=348818 RepID=UPI000689CA94|nr:siderophore-interacting protein [Phaeacidiphilus oryzae]